MGLIKTSYRRGQKMKGKGEVKGGKKYTEGGESPNFLIRPWKKENK